MKKVMSFLLMVTLFLWSLPVFSVSAYTMPDVEVDTIPAIEEYEQSLTPSVWVGGEKISVGDTIRFAQGGSATMTQVDGVYTLTLDNAKITSDISFTPDEILKMLGLSNQAVTKQFQDSNTISFGLLSNIPLHIVVNGDCSIVDVDYALMFVPVFRGKMVFSGDHLTLSGAEDSFLGLDDGLAEYENILLDYLCNGSAPEDFTEEEYNWVMEQFDKLYEKIVGQYMGIEIADGMRLTLAPTKHVENETRITAVCYFPIYLHGVLEGNLDDIENSGFYLLLSQLYNYGTLDIRGNQLNPCFNRIKNFENHGTANILINDTLSVSNLHQVEGVLSVESELVEIRQTATFSGGKTNVVGKLQADNLSITGGDLTVFAPGDTGTALNAMKKFDMSGGTVTATAADYGVYVGSSSDMYSEPGDYMHVSGGSLTATATNSIGTGVYAFCGEDISITGGNHVFRGGNDYFGAVKKARDAAGFSVNWADSVLLENATVDMEGAIGFSSSLSPKVTVEKGANITARGIISGIYVYSGDLYLNGGTVDASCVGEGEHRAPILTDDYRFTSSPDDQSYGYIHLADSLTKVDGAKGTTIQSSNLIIDETSSRFMQFLGTEQSSLTLDPVDHGDSYFHYIAKDIPMSVVVTDGHEHSYTEHILVPPTEAGGGLAEYVCDACGDTYQTALAHTHLGTLVPGTPATCTADGVKDYYTCSCGKYFEDASCLTEIVDLEAWKLGDGKIAKTAHLDQDRDGTCDVCSMAIAQDSTSGSDVSNSQTGENHNALLWMVLLLASGMVVMAAVAITKKKSAND